MKTVRVYELCDRCNGHGFTQNLTRHWNDGILTTRVSCDACAGTGKGRLREIREEMETSVVVIDGPCKFDLGAF